MNRLICILIVFFMSCSTQKNKNVLKEMTAAEILGNVDYQAICYGGYRTNSRTIEPTIPQIKEDMRILSALKVKLIRTYNVHHLEVSNLMKAIRELKAEDANFEMYVMLGAWIDCRNAWTDLEPDHDHESERNKTEIEEAMRLVNQYPDIIKIVAVGNEAMVKWATNYYVQPGVILKWVTHLQNAKKQGLLPKDLWVTSSDNFASWGGGEAVYHVEDLNRLIEAVDFISMHTYPMHDTHYNPVFWGIREEESQLNQKEKVNAMMMRARDYAIGQYNSVARYVKSIGLEKPIHIGETGWATADSNLYGNKGSKATDEYKSGVYFRLMRDWTNSKGISCFYFEAFDENWKDARNPLGSENHFGLINLKGEVKYGLWDYFDTGALKGLKRDGKVLTKTYGGVEKSLWLDVALPSEAVLN